MARRAFSLVMTDEDRRRIPKPHTRERVRLTRRERQLLAEIVLGQSNRAIAMEYGVAEQTVRNQLTVLFEKLGVSTRLELAVLAIRENFLEK